MAWTPPPGIELRDAFYEIMPKINHREWNTFARRALGLEQIDVDEIRSDYQGKSKEQKFQMLMKWKEMVGPQASVDYLYAVLNYYLLPDECPKPVTPPVESNKDNIAENPNDLRPAVDAQTFDLADYCSQVVDINVQPCSRLFFDESSKMKSNYCRRKGKGRVLIVNNSFMHCSDSHRQGSKVDVTHMDSLWKKLGCEVKISEDLHADDILSELKNFSDLCGGYDYCVVIIMSHGTSEGGCDFVFGNDGEKIPVKTILDMYNNENSTHLQGIPKLFFFQFCRGDGQDTGVAPCGSTHNAAQPIPQHPGNLSDSRVLPFVKAKERTQADSGPISAKLPKTSDMLIAYATQFGQEAYRNTEYGSWFINAITNVFMKHAKDEHVLDMIIKVNEAVSEKETNAGECSGLKSMPDIGMTMRKKLYLYPGFSS